MLSHVPRDRPWRYSNGWEGSPSFTWKIHRSIGCRLQSRSTTATTATAANTTVSLANFQTARTVTAFLIESPDGRVPFPHPVHATTDYSPSCLSIPLNTRILVETFNHSANHVPVRLLVPVSVPKRPSFPLARSLKRRYPIRARNSRGFFFRKTTRTRRRRFESIQTESRDRVDGAVKWQLFRRRGNGARCKIVRLANLKGLCELRLSMLINLNCVFIVSRRILFEINEVQFPRYIFTIINERS